MSNHNNIYNILGKLNALLPKNEQPAKAEAKPIYESVDARGSVLEGVGKVEARLAQQFAESSMDEAVRGVNYTMTGLRPPETQAERGQIAQRIKGQRAANRADPTVTGYGNRVAPQRGAASAGGFSNVQTTDPQGQAAYTGRDIDPAHAGYAGKLNIRPGAGKGVIGSSEMEEGYEDHGDEDDIRSRRNREREDREDYEADHYEEPDDMDESTVSEAVAAFTPDDIKAAMSYRNASGPIWEIKNGKIRFYLMNMDRMALDDMLSRPLATQQDWDMLKKQIKKQLQSGQDTMGEGAMTPKQKKFAKLAPPTDKITYADKIAGAKKSGLDEETHGQWLKQKEAEAKQSGKNKFSAFKQTHDVTGGAAKEQDDEESLEEGFEDLKKYMAGKEKGAKQGGGAGKKEGTRYGGSKQKDDEGDTEVSKTKGRPKKDKFAEGEQLDELSPATLSSYAAKAKGQQNWAAGRAYVDPSSPPSYRAAKQQAVDPGGKFSNVAAKRGAGYEKAVAKGATDITKSGASPTWDWSKDKSPAALNRPVTEKAVSKQQQKFMGMAHAIQKGETIPGASKELKAAAKGMSKKAAHDFAATKHKGLPNRVSEGVNFSDMMREANANADELLTELQMEIAEFKKSGNMGDKLRDVLELHKFSKKPVVDEVVMPAVGVDAVSPAEKLAPHAGVGRGPIGRALGQASTIAKNVGRFVTRRPEIPTLEDAELNELAKLAGLSEAKKCNHTKKDQKCPVHGLKECGTGMYEAKSKPDYLDFDKDGDKKEPMKKALKDKEKVDECGMPGQMSPMSSMGQEAGTMSVNTSLNSDGTKSVSVNATGEHADALAQMLKMAGMAAHSPSHDEQPQAVVIASSEEPVEEEREEQYANSPDEEYAGIDVQTRGGDGEVAGMEKNMHHGGSARFSDNPLAAESIEMPKSISKMLEGIKKVEEAEEKWIQKAIKHPGALTKKAKAAHMGTQEFAKKHAHDKGTIGKQSRLAQTLSKIAKK